MKQKCFTLQQKVFTFAFSPPEAATFGNPKKGVYRPRSQGQRVKHPAASTNFFGFESLSQEHDMYMVNIFLKEIWLFFASLKPRWPENFQMQWALSDLWAYRRF